MDGYYIYKNDSPILPLASGGDFAVLHTFGGRVAGDVGEHVKYRTEGAVQVGNKNNQEVAAFALNDQVSYHFKDSMKNQVRLSYEYLPGMIGTQQAKMSNSIFYGDDGRNGVKFLSVPTSRKPAQPKLPTIIVSALATESISLPSSPLGQITMFYMPTKRTQPVLLLMLQPTLA